MIPHSIAFWLQWEIHERNPNGSLLASPVDCKNYRGVLHCENKEDAKRIIDKIINNFKENLKDENAKLSS